MPDVISSIFDQSGIGAPFFSGGAYSNFIFRQGEVLEIIYPDSPKSVSKTFTEYNVLVAHYENEVIGHKLYHNCRLINSLAGGADRCTWTLRASTKPVEDYKSSDGSKVLVLCVEGSYNRAIIVGGILDERCGGDNKQDGHHFNWEFNGVNFKVNDDGSWDITNKGKNTNLGNPDPKADQNGIGTTVKVEANGNFIVSSPKNNQSVVIDNTNNTITINGDQDVTIDGSSIHLGKNADEQSVLGNQLVGILQELIQAITTQTSFTFGVPGTVTSPPINAPVFLAIMAKLQTILSQQTFVKRG